MDSKSCLLRPVIAIPAKNEAERLPKLLAALARQTWLSTSPRPLDVIVVLNNCDDHSADAIDAAAKRHNALRIEVTNVRFPPPAAHVGTARRLAMERARHIGGPDCVLLSTDADTAPASDWIEASLRVIGAGADLVGGHLIADRREQALLGPSFSRRAAHHREYAMLVDRLGSLVDPDPNDPWPRHADHTGASLAVRGDVYSALGGMPAISVREDVAFVAKAIAAGYRLRHSLDVRVTVSARLDGRARGGMADCLKAWLAAEANGAPHLVDSAAAVFFRLARRRRARVAWASNARHGRSLPRRAHPIWLPRELADACQDSHAKPIEVETAIKQMKQIIAASPEAIRVA